MKNPSANAAHIRDVGSVPGSGRSPGEGHGNPLQCSCLESPMHRGDWWLQSMGLHRVRHDGSDLACMQTIGSLKARVNSCSSFTEYCFSDIFFYLFESAKLSKHA